MCHILRPGDSGFDPLGCATGVPLFWFATADFFSSKRTVDIHPPMVYELFLTHPQIIKLRKSLSVVFCSLFILQPTKTENSASKNICIRWTVHPTPQEEHWKPNSGLISLVHQP